MPALSPTQVQRYARQILVPEVGRAGQERWVASKRAAPGEGAALEAAVELVAAAGVGVERTDSTTAAGTEAGPTGLSATGLSTTGSSPGPTGLAQLGELVLGETAFADRRAGCERCIGAFFEEQPRLAAAERSAMAFATG